MATQKFSQSIITLCQTPSTALQAIHLLITHGSASESAFCAIYDRVMADNDVDGAYYLAVFAQQIDDLPFDGKPLIDVVMKSGDHAMKVALIDKLPKEAQQDYLNRL